MSFNFRCATTPSVMMINTTRHWNPTRLGTDLSFIFFVTLFLGSIGGLMNLGYLDFVSEHFSSKVTWDQTWVFSGGIVIAVFLPLAIIALFFDQVVIRRVFTNLLVVLFVQLLSEYFIVKYFSSDLVGYLSLTYILFRLWQIWEGMKLIKKCSLVRPLAKRVSHAALLLNLLLWTAVLIPLLTRF